MQKILFILIFFCFSASSYALGKQGHQLMCQLTYNQLSTAHQSALDELLATLPNKEKRRINKYNRLKPNTPITLATACTWADAIKSDAEYDAFKPWHYLNVSRSQERITAQTCQQDCVTQAIKFHRQQLAASNLSALDRAKALMFLAHWIGDIHQPLHVSFASDLGGNKLSINPFVGKCKNLHWYWDQCLLYPPNRQKQPLNKYWQSMLESILTPDKMKKWQQGTLYDWANESLLLVRSPATQYCQLEGIHCAPPAELPLVISKDYHERNQQVLLNRIAQASVRLTQVIQQHIVVQH